MRIVFVCTTNVWGSAMADLMARSLLAEWDPDRQKIQVESVGVRAQVGAPIPAATQKVLAERGLEPRNHRARWMSPETLAGANLVLTMGAVQREAALALHPRGLRSTFTLLEAAQLVSSADLDGTHQSGSELHAQAVVAGMAAARRFRSASARLDDLPDLVGEDIAQLRLLADRVHHSVITVLRAISKTAPLLDSVDAALRDTTEHYEDAVVV